MNFSVLNIALILSCCISVAAIIIALRSMALLREQQAQTEKLYQRLSKELSISSSGAVGMGQRLLAMEKRLQNEPTPPHKIDYYNDEDFQPYSQATQLFKMGLDCEEVARRCGLSRAEASLIQMMQAKSTVNHS